jgi:DNA-binding LacI/PurR family transcriptional regulator/anti-anti-sigma regulatory factor
MNKSNNVRSSKTRPTIGFLGYGPSEPLNATVWAGIADVARERDVNLINFPGNPLQSRRGFEAQANVLYDLVSSARVDGLVIWAGTLSHHAGAEAVERMCERYRPLPMVNLGALLAGIPSLLLDNYQGMYDAVTHLIEVHQHSRIAFLRGPVKQYEAIQRYKAYTDAMSDHGLAVDPELVVHGDYKRSSGWEAIRLLLDERHVTFDALAAANDNSAIGTIEALQERGLKVPGDVAVVGLDDIKESRCVTPTLTTAVYPFYEYSRRVTEMLLALMAGEEQPERLILRSGLAIRQSCGCPNPLLTVGETVAKKAKSSKTAFADQRETILAEMLEAVGDSAEARQWAGKLLDALAAEMTGKSTDGFLAVLDQALPRLASVGDDVVVWHQAMAMLRCRTQPYFEGTPAAAQLEAMWQTAQLLVGDAGQRAHAYQELQAEHQARIANELSQALVTTFDVKDLVDIIARELPRLGVPSCYLSLYEDPQSPATSSRLLLAYNRQGRIEADDSFPSHLLAPDSVWPQDGPYSMVVEPLYFREDQLGLAIFEARPAQETLCDTLRGQISSALKGALILQARREAEEALEQAYKEVEKQVEERTLALQREVTERQRAQEDNLRLQQEIIEAQKQALEELSTPIIPVMDNIIVMPLIGSIDTYRAKDITRALLSGIREQRAKVVILDITGVPVVDTGVANHLNKTILAARLKGARAIITGMSDAVAETIVDLGVDWSGVETLADLQTGLRAALHGLGIDLIKASS